MAVAAVEQRKRPVPDDDGAVGCRAEGAAGEKRSRFSHETVKEARDALHSIVDDYETVEEDYEFDSIDDYEMLEDFGSSPPPCGSGGVARARDRCTGEMVGIRRVRAQSTDGGDNCDGGASLRAAVREAGCLAACRGHASVLQLKSVATDEATGAMFVVMEPPPAGACTLRSRLTRRFPEPVARALMRQLLGAAAQMHGAGVTHRDINPDNILVGPDGALKICGFGCAATTSTTSHDVGEPEPPKGTMLYRSPEQLYGVARYGPEEDIWALGCVMAEVLAGGAALFTADTEEDLLAQTIDLRDDIVTMGLEAFDGGVLEELSVGGRELLAGLLEFDWWERPTAAGALKHRWFTQDN